MFAAPLLSCKLPSSVSGVRMSLDTVNNVKRHTDA